MQYIVYALKSRNHAYIYVGLTNNLKRRIHQHNSGMEQTTKPYSPFDLIYHEIVSTRIEARKRAKYLKSGIGKEFLKTLKVVK